MDRGYCFDKTNGEVRVFVTYSIIIAFFYFEWEIHIFISSSQQINLITAYHPILDDNYHDQKCFPRWKSLSRQNWSTAIEAVTTKMFKKTNNSQNCRNLILFFGNLQVPNLFIYITAKGLWLPLTLHHYIAPV